MIEKAKDEDSKDIPGRLKPAKAETRGLADILGEEAISSAIHPFIDYLETCIAAFERDGSQIGEIEAGNDYCRLLLEGGRKKARKGKTSCCAAAAQTAAIEAIKSGREAEKICVGGVTMMAVPITANEEAIGACVGSVSEPATGEESIREAADACEINRGRLEEAVDQYHHKPDYLYDAARKHLQQISGTIASLYANILEKDKAMARIGRREAELAAAREFDESILNSTAASVVAYDRDLKINIWNPATEAITGRPAAEVVGKHLNNIYPKAASKGFNQIINQVMASRETWHGEPVSFKSPVSGDLLLDISVTPLRDGRGEITGVLVLSENVSERIRLEQDLKERNQRLDLLQSVTAKSVSRLASGKALQTLVDEVATIFGYQMCNIFMPTPDGSKMQLVASHGYDAKFMEELNKGEAFNFDNEGFLKTPVANAYRDGRQHVLADVLGTPDIYPVLKYAARHHNFNTIAATPMEFRGEPLGALTVFASEAREFPAAELEFLKVVAAQAASITGTTRIYSRLAESEERYRELYNGAADWMYTMDENGVITSCNDTMVDALGYPHKELIGRHIYDFERADDRDQAIPDFRKTKETGKFAAERHFIARDGAEFVVEINARLLRDESGRIVQWRAVARDVTQKKEAERRINLLVAAVENTQESVIISDLDGVIISINGAGAGYFGLPVEELTGKSISGLWSDKNPQDLGEQILKMSARNGWQGQLWYKRPDGTEFPAFVSSKRVDDESGNAVALVSISRDISSELRMTEEILRRNRELAVLNMVAATAAESLDLESILNSCLTSVIESMDYDGGTIYLLGEDRKSLTPLATNNMPDDLLARVKKLNFGEGYSGHVAVTGEALFMDDTKSSPYRMPDAPAKPWFASVGAVPLESKDQLMGVLIVGTKEQHDFSELEKDLLASVAKTIGVAVENARLFRDITNAKAQWETTFDAMTNGVSIHDRDYTILRANRALAKLLGTTTSELIGKKCYEIFHGLKQPIAGCPQKKALTEGKNVTVVLEDPNLGKILSVSADPIFDAEGNILGTVHDVRDITEQEHLRDQINQTEKLTALGEMAGGVAHDFNNFLTVILGNAQLLLSHASDDFEEREPLETIERAATDAAETVRRIQEFTRVRTSRSFQLVDVNEVIRNALGVARPRWKDEADARGVTIGLNLDMADLPLVNANESELGEVFVNLFLNASDALPKGGEISIRTLHGDGWVEVLVADNGLGMDEDVQRRIFEPFFTTKGPGGSGLGLSVVYGIVGRHGGEIMVESKRGEGTVFTMKLPAASKAEIGEAKPTEAAPDTTRPARVLVIDDAVMIRTLLMSILQGMRHSVETAQSGAEGIEKFTQVHSDPARLFDVVLTDLGMPGMSGWEVAERIKEMSPDTPVALMTGWGDQLDADKMKESKVDTVIAKPFRVEEIRALISQAMAEDE